MTAWPQVARLAGLLSSGLARGPQKKACGRRVRGDTALLQGDRNSVPFILSMRGEDDTLLNSSTYTDLEFENGPENLTGGEEAWPRQSGRCQRLPPPAGSVLGCLGVSRTSYSHNPKQIGFRHRGKPHGLAVASALAPRSAVNRQHMAAGYGADYGPRMWSAAAMRLRTANRALLFSLLQPPLPKRGRRTVVSQSQQSLPSTADSVASCLT